MTHEEHHPEDVVKFSDATPLERLRGPGRAEGAAVLRRAAGGDRAGQVAAGSPLYPQISSAIYKNVNQALSGAMSPEDALKKAQTDMENALKTF